MNEFSGRTALVTGVSSGIGRAIFEHLHSQGAMVIGVDKDPYPRNAEVSDGMRLEVADVCDYGKMRKLVSEVADQCGHIDILINNAGYQETRTIDETGLDCWRRQLEVNLESAFMLIKEVLPVMRRRGYGRIVNVASVQAMTPEANVSAYASSKGGMISLTKAVAVEAAAAGVLVNAVAPGCIRTQMSIINGVDETTTEDFRSWYIDRRKIPLARPGTPEEVAETIAFLCSEKCSYLTGHCLVVDGGLSATF
jgi:3-oxoacyl-[acyl-carrier protein] reductase